MSRLLAFSPASEPLERAASQVIKWQAADRAAMNRTIDSLLRDKVRLTKDLAITVDSLHAEVMDARRFRNDGVRLGIALVVIFCLLIHVGGKSL